MTTSSDKYKTALTSEVGVSSYTSLAVEKRHEIRLRLVDIRYCRRIRYLSERLGEIYDSVKNDFEREYPDCTLFTYDFEKIVSDTQTNARGARERDAKYRIY